MIANSDALIFLKTMNDETVHCCITSPPYFGLRAYKTTPVLWDANPTCLHEWGTVHPPGQRSSDANPGKLQSEGTKNRENLTSQFCLKCGAWNGELGLEPTPEYTKKLLSANDRGDWYPRIGTTDKREDGTKHGKLEGNIKPEYITTSWQPTCTCNAEPIPALVLDPFAGSSATGVACKWHNRNYLGIELNPEYCKLGEQRILEGK